METVIKGADGKLYRNVGGDEYEPYTLPSGSEMVERSDGSCFVREVTDASEVVEVAMRDDAEYARQRDPRSSDEHFRKQRQKVKRVEVMEKQAQQLATRVEPGPGAGVRYIKDEEALSLLEEHKEAHEKGDGCDFQPLSTYAHKITKARPLLKGEVGVRGNEILCLEGGYGEGTLISVPTELNSKGD